MRRARDVKEQLEELMKRVEIELKFGQNDFISIAKTIVSGFFFNTALLGKTGNYKTFKFRQTVTIHPSSCLREEMPKWVVFNEFVLTTKKFIRTVIKIDPKWLLEVAPHIYRKEDLEIEKKMPKLKKSAVSK
ncbi:putative pre-mRNA-splicing factor ATP-dependent RNA helicase dhx16 [Bonamia ostreae]|uniref:Pre-mRNA-splicing factor ATP-dependent RNA helicase dhx16 n=1 Tax=Bonamia ostreae TaxID=126728 RepID=A0ABV2AQX1_9EUKA